MSTLEIVQSVVDEASAVAAVEGISIKLAVETIPGATMLCGYDAIVVVGMWLGQEHRCCAGTSGDTRPAYDVRYELRKWLGKWLQEARGRIDKKLSTTCVPSVSGHGEIVEMADVARPFQHRNGS